MELAPRLSLMNWLVSQGLTGLPENDLIRGFCERCRAAGLDATRQRFLGSTGRFALRIGRAQDLYTLDPEISADEVIAGGYERYLAR